MPDLSTDPIFITDLNPNKVTILSCRQSWLLKIKQRKNTGNTAEHYCYRSYKDFILYNGTFKTSANDNTLFKTEYAV